MVKKRSDEGHKVNNRPSKSAERKKRRRAAARGKGDGTRAGSILTSGADESSTYHPELYSSRKVRFDKGHLSPLKRDWLGRYQRKWIRRPGRSMRAARRGNRSSGREREPACRYRFVFAPIARNEAAGRAKSALRLRTKGLAGFLGRWDDESVFGVEKSTFRSCKVDRSL